jgi:hypothetical protein
MRKPTGKGTSSNRITADYVQPATAANRGAKHYAQKRSKVVRTSPSVLAVKTRTGGRNRKERRGS